MQAFKKDFQCHYYLAPPTSDTPSAFFPVGLPENPSIEPNMEFQDVILT